ncbi:protein yellow [Halyomorpha halys]|uniref:protein yellow n=1 Tax=Halyomorpha halys TaxID=286706 RepID=UPI0006D4E836|nr:protein yellow [Halyomorpha halys]
MWRAGLTLISLLVLIEAKNDKLKEVFKWNHIDFAYPDEQTRSASIASGEYKKENNMPLGIEIWKDKVFITVPRWKTGVPSSLNFVKLTDGESPLLHPYPNWATNNVTEEKNYTIGNTFRVRADECDRLWVIDSGLINIVENAKVLSPPKIMIFNLTTDELIREYHLKPSDIKDDSFFANIVVDVSPDKCDEAFAYLPDLGSYCLVVYNFKENDSYRINHHYFHFDPLYGDYNISGVNFQWTDGLFGIALSPLKENGYRTMYFHPLSSINEFTVSTDVVQNKTAASESYHEFKLLGSRGPNSQATTSFIDEKSGVMFYTQVNKNGVGCWNSKKFPNDYSVDTNTLVVSDKETMVFPNDLKVDRDSNLWVLTDRLPEFIYRKLNYDNINFRVFKAPVAEVIKGTVCDN